MEISLNIQSYKRAGRVDTFSLLPYCNLWVHSFEADEYREYYGDSVKVLPDETRGNLPKVKNYILDQSKADVTVIMDDDISYFGYWENKKAHTVPIEMILPWIEKYTIVAQELGARLWGINVNPDKQVYREYSPFSTISYVSSSFSCFLKNNELRYDPRLPLKEDYDMLIQHCNMYRKLLRVNKFYYMKKSATMTGGCADYRNIDKEAEQMKMLQEKWGNNIVKGDTLNNSRAHSTTKKRNFDINPIVTIPILGI